MDEKLKKEIKEKYYNALFIQKKLLEEYTYFSCTESHINELKKELAEINDFFRNLAP